MVSIGIIGDFEKDFLPHLATEEALQHASKKLKIEIIANWLGTESLIETAEQIKKLDGIWIAPGNLYKSVKGAVNGIQVARENNIPTLGTCRGFQHLLIEFGRNILNVMGGEVECNDPYFSEIVLARKECSLNDEWINIKLKTNSLAYNLYHEFIVREQDVCSFEINMAYRNAMESNGLKITGTDMGQFPRIVNYTKNNFYMGTLFVPQLNSSYENPHPITIGFLQAALNYSNQK